MKVWIESFLTCLYLVHSPEKDMNERSRVTFSNFGVESEMSIFFHLKYLNHLQAIELMVVDALLKANDCLDITSYIQDPSQYWKVRKPF